MDVDMLCAKNFQKSIDIAQKRNILLFVFSIVLKKSKRCRHQWRRSRTMHMGDRPPTASFYCPSQVLVLEKSDFPISVNSALLRARESSVFTRDGKIFWVILPDNPNKALSLNESALRAELINRNKAAHMTRESS